MNWLSRILPGGEAAAALDPALRDRLDTWRQLPRANLTARHDDVRYVVVNTEATGLDLTDGKLVSIAAIGVNRCALGSRDSFFHLIDPDAADALVALLEFIGKSPIVVFNSGFNKRALMDAFKKHLGFEPELDWLDLFWLLPGLIQERHSSPVRLTQWMQTMEIESSASERSLRDAHAIAQLLLVALSRAKMAGRRTPTSLIDMESTKRRVLRIT